MPKLPYFIAGLCSIAVFCNVAVTDGATKPVIEIKAESELTLGVQEDFRFNCTAVSKNYTISLLVDGQLNSTKLNRITNTTESKETNAIKFVFSGTTVKDNGTTFMCGATDFSVANATTNFSDVLTLQIECLSADVSIKTPVNVTEGMNYTFTCEAVNPANFTVYVVSAADKNDTLERIITGKKTASNTSQEFILMNTTYHDNGTVLQCVADELYRSNTSDVVILWPPYSLGPVVTPTLKAGNTTYDVILNISANPAITYTEWKRHGKDITNDTNIAPGLSIMSFLSLLPADNGSFSAIVYNDVGNVTILFDMMVLYPPIIKISRHKIDAFLKSREAIYTAVDANPANYTYEWIKDGYKLNESDKLFYGSDYLEFRDISNEDSGDYSYKVTNDEGSAANYFELSIYDGPYFEEGKSNGSVLSEIKTGSNSTITCTVKKSYPKVTDLRIEPATGTNWKTKKENDSITLTIDKASADNRRNFTCYAVNNVTTATLTFTNFVGGAPDKVVVDVKKVVTVDNEVQLTLNVTDSSDAPATEILVYLKEVMKKNRTLNLPSPSLNKKVVSFEFKNAIVENFEALGAGTHNVTMYARNLIGDVRLKDYSFTTPSKPKPKSNKKSSTIKIAVGVSVPVAVIIVIAVIAIGGYFFYRKRKNGEYSPLSVQADDGTEDSSKYSVTN